MPTTTGLATSFITFSRPGASGGGATVTDRDGKIKWAGHNLLTNSESFDASAWSKGRVTVAANAVAAPNGTTTADSLTQQSGQTTGGYALQNVTSQASAYTISFFAKANGKNFVAVFETLQSASEVYSWINVSTGAAGTAGSGHTILTPVSLGSGWYLCTIQLTAVARSGYIGISLADTNGSYTVVDSGGVHLWGAHLYRSDMQMQLNPAQPAGMQSYYPTSVANRLGYTEDFSNGSWVKSNIAAFGSGSVANATIAPNGLQTADLIVENTANSDHQIYSSQTLVAGTPYTWTIHAKAFTRSWIWLNAQDGSDRRTWVNLATGIVGTNAAGNTATVTSLPNGWWRISVSRIATSASGFFAFGTATGDGVSVYTGDGTSGIYVWGAQLSDSASLDTYVPVYGAAVTSAAYYAPRLDFDGATLAAKGLLVEELRTNLQVNSNVFGTATFQTTVTPDAAVSPSGLTDASSLACTSTTGRAILSTSVTSGTVYVLSVFIKAGTNTSAYIEPAGTAGTNGPVVFNLSTGTVTSGTGGAIAPAPNGYYRCSVTFTASGTGASDLRIGTGDATSKTIFVYGAQLEANATFATSYIPTPASATATRTADVASVSTQAFPYSGTEGTYVVSFVPVVSDTNSVVLSITDSSASNRIYTAGAASEHLVIASSGTPQVNLDAGSVTVGAVNKVGAAFAANNFAAVINGGTAATSTSGLMPVGVLNMSIGNYNVSGTYRSYHIRQVTYLPRRISNAELQSRTA